MKTTPPSSKPPATTPAAAPAKKTQSAMRPRHTSANYWTQSDEIQTGPNLLKRGIAALKQALKRP